MPHFDADQWSVLLITVIFGAARLVVAAFAARPLISQLGQKAMFPACLRYFHLILELGRCSMQSACFKTATAATFALQQISSRRRHPRRLLHFFDNG
jgi:cell division protein FtsL